MNKFNIAIIKPNNFTVDENYDTTLTKDSLKDNIKDLIEFIISGPVIQIVLEMENSVEFENFFT